MSMFRSRFPIGILVSAACLLSAAKSSCVGSQQTIELSSLLAISYVVNVENEETGQGILSAQITYKGLGWVGFGVSVGSGSMVPAEVIIGIPGEPLGINNPGKYRLSSRDNSGVSLFPESYQTLINSTIVQTDSKTVLTFHKHLVEPDEIPIDGNGRTTFIWAHGFGNTLSVHADRGAFVLILRPCNKKDSDEHHSVVVIETPERYRSLWTAHGVFGGIAWGVFVPLAISSSLLRDMIPWKGLWFKIHMSLNLLAAFFTAIAFLVAVAATEKSTVKDESPSHFTKAAHQAVGFVIVVFVTLQALVGFFRPHRVRALGLDETVGDGDKRPNQRFIWKICHKAVGFALLATGWWQVQEGLKLYSARFGVTRDLTTGFWITVMVIAVGTAAFYASNKHFLTRGQSGPQH